MRIIDLGGGSMDKSQRNKRILTRDDLMFFLANGSRCLRIVESIAAQKAPGEISSRQYNAWILASEEEPQVGVLGQ